MGYRSVIIENPAYISGKSGQLIIRTDREHSVPIEDISALVIANNASTVTAAALSALGEGGCAVYFCDSKHLPCAVLTPYHQHSRQLAVMKKQLSMSEPMKKRLWQKIVEVKIKNQAACLDLCSAEGGEALRKMCGHIKSGDTGNVEGAAARKYFPLLFGENFRRNDEECGYNAALNYGYAILRGAVARNISASGLLPALGIHHKSELDQFCLADDLIEPFRPITDLMVKQFDLSDELTPSIKRSLVNLLNMDIAMKGEKQAVSRAIEMTVQSFAAVISKEKEELLLPELIALNQHSYE